MLYLHIAGQHRVCWSQDSSQQDTGTPGKSHSVNACQRDGEHGQSHRTERKPKGTPPTAVMKWYSQFQSCCEKRNDDGDLSHSLDKSCLPDQVNLDEAETLRSQADVSCEWPQFRSDPLYLYRGERAYPALGLHSDPER